MKYFLFIPLLLSLMVSCVQKPRTVENLWPSEIERYWVGPQFLSIPQMDWKLDSGRLLCIKPGINRAVVMLTKRIVNPMDGFEISFEGGFINDARSAISKMGMMLGLDEPINNKIDFSKGLFAGVSASGNLILDNLTSELNSSFIPGEKLIFYLEGVPNEDESLHLLLRVRSAGNDIQLGEITTDIEPGEVKGLLSLFSNVPDMNAEPVSWFESLELNGKGIKIFSDKTRGPLLDVQKIFKDDTVVLNIRLVPVIIDNKSMVVLQSRGDGEWENISKSPINKEYFVRFEIPSIKKNRNLSFRIYTHYIDKFGSLKYQYLPVSLNDK